MRAFTSVAFLVGIATFAPFAYPQVANPLDRKDWLSDYELLKSELERSYSHLAWVASPESGVDLPSLESRTMQGLQGAQSLKNAKAAILEFVAGFRDGHLGSTPLPEPPTASIEPPTPSGITDAGTACAAYGYEARTSVSFSLPFESLRGFTLYTDGLTEPFRSDVLDLDGLRVGIVRIPRFRAREYPALCRQLWVRLKTNGERSDSDAITRGIDLAWLESLASRLRRFKQEKVAALLVDVGGNGGGNDLGDWAVRAFTDKPIRSPQLLLAAGPVAIPYFDEQLQSLHSALLKGQNSQNTKQALQQAIDAFERRKRIASSTGCSMSWVWRERRRWGSQECKRLVESGYSSGELDFAEAGTFETFVITDRGTGSAAEGFTALMRDSGIARTIGVRTWGDGCGFMDAGKPLVLPHVQLAFRIPNCVRLRADGTDEVAGVIPDIEISLRPGESARARADRLLSSVLVELRRSQVR